MTHDDGPSIRRGGDLHAVAEPARPGLGRSALAAGSGVVALALMIVALVAGGGRPPAATSALVGAPGAAGAEEPITTVPEGSVTDLATITTSTVACDLTSGAPTTRLCPTPSPEEPSTTAVITQPFGIVPTSTVRSPGTPPPPPPSMTSSTTAEDHTRPAGITVDVRLASTTLVAGQAVDATVRIRNATGQAFSVFIGCGVTWVELRDGSGNDITDRTDAEPCGTPGHFFNPATVPAGGQLERVLPLAPSPRATPGTAQVLAAWARDTGAGLIHYIQAAPVNVQVAPPP